MTKSAVFLRYLRKVFLLKKEEEESITYKEVEENIYFYGHNLWILGFSMIIASIGLNMNSAAAVIGAMLISPLMGPIIGVGFGLAIHNFEMIGRSLRHWLLAVIISLMASTLYFIITPVHDPTSQLFSFIRPTIFDALLAFFGGLSGFLGIARKDGNKVISGVAIATACMPPLCTTGYGIANLQWEYIWGGFYFYFINCLFIGIGSMLIARYMNFSQLSIPVKNTFLHQYASRIAYVISIMAIIPCIFIFAEMFRENNFKKNAEKFIASVGEKDHAILTKSFVYGKDSSLVELTFVGSASDHAPKDSLQQLLSKYAPGTFLKLHYTNPQENVNEPRLRELINRLNTQDSIIQILKKKTAGL